MSAPKAENRRMKWRLRVSVVGREGCPTLTSHAGGSAHPRWLLPTPHCPTSSATPQNTRLGPQLAVLRSCCPVSKKSCYCAWPTLCPGFLSNKMEIIIQPCRADGQMRANKYLKWEKNKAQWLAAGESEVMCHWIYCISTGSMEYARERTKSPGRRWFSAFEIVKKDALRSQEPSIKHD